MNFKRKQFIYLFAIVLFAFNFNIAKSQCNCNFEYEIMTVELSNGSHLVHIDIQTNGNYSINGQNHEVCYSEHPDDTNYIQPFILNAGNVKAIDIIITNLDTNCTEEILEIYLSITQNILSCEEGCTVNECDLWIDVKSDRFNIYKYPDQGFNTILLYRELGTGPGFNQTSTSGHYFKVLTQPCTTYELNYIKYCPVLQEWSNWTGWFEASSFCPKIGNDRIDEVSKFGSNKSIDISQKIEVFPNPSNGNINITSPSFEELSEGVIEMFDLSGKLISTENLNFEGSNAKINLEKNSLTNGIYFANIISGSKIFTTEIIIEK